jgi:peroxiredoxin
LPDIEQAIYQEYRDQGVLVYGIHSGDDPGLLADFREQTGVTFPFERDEGTRVMLSFPEGVGYPYPRDVVVDKSLTIRSVRNSFSAEETRALVEQLLAE